MTLALIVAVTWALLATGGAVLLARTIRLREHRHPAAHRADVAERADAEWGRPPGMPDTGPLQGAGESRR